MTIGHVRHQPTAGRISQKRAGGECQAEKEEKCEEHGQSMAVTRPAVLEEGCGFIGGGGKRLFLRGWFEGFQRADGFKIDIGKRMKDGFEGVVGRPGERTGRHGLRE